MKGVSLAGWKAEKNERRKKQDRVMISCFLRVAVLIDFQHCSLTRTRGSFATCYDNVPRNDQTKLFFFLFVNVIIYSNNCTYEYEYEYMWYHYCCSAGRTCTGSRLAWQLHRIVRTHHTLPVQTERITRITAAAAVCGASVYSAVFLSTEHVYISRRQ